MRLIIECPRHKHVLRFTQWERVNHYANEDLSGKLEHELFEGRRRGKPPKSDDIT